MVRGAYSIYSRFLGRLVSTSVLTRLKRKGFNIECMVDTRVRFRRSTTSAWPLLSSIDEKSNQLWKLPRSLNMSGSRKCSSDHSSVMLFCNGVPVIRSLFAELYVRSSLMSLQFMFFRRCPSSFCHLSFCTVLMCRQGGLRNIPQRYTSIDIGKGTSGRSYRSRMRYRQPESPRSSDP